MDHCNLLCVDFTAMDPLRDGKENVLVLTGAFSKFSQAFVTPNQKALTHGKNNSGQVVLCLWNSSSEYIVTKADLLQNAILEHLYTMYGVKLGLNNLQPCYTTCVEIPTVRGLTICSMIY